MTQKEIAKTIGKSEQTLINWRKKYPMLYQAVVGFYNAHGDFRPTQEEIEMLSYFRGLPEEDQEMYRAEIKALALRLGKKRSP